jgi:hypothetical protein
MKKPYFVVYAGKSPFYRESFPDELSATIAMNKYSGLASLIGPSGKLLKSKSMR